MFENVNIDWHISQDDGSTDFSDDENLDDPLSTNTLRLSGSKTPENKQNRFHYFLFNSSFFYHQQASEWII